MVEVEENPARRMPLNQDLFGLACCRPAASHFAARCSMQLDGLPLQIHRSKPTLAVCVCLLTQFEHKPIPPRADAEARARGPPLAASIRKKKFY